MDGSKPGRPYSALQSHLTWIGFRIRTETVSG